MSPLYSHSFHTFPRPSDGWGYSKKFSSNYEDIFGNGKKEKSAAELKAEEAKTAAAAKAADLDSIFGKK